MKELGKAFFVKGYDQGIESGEPKGGTTKMQSQLKNGESLHYYIFIFYVKETYL